ncbi:MAG: WD40/YVTN/BNR-like repeat-containing protein, partial [Terriglobales bacterium]
AVQLGGPIPSSDWRSVGGGESGWAQPDPVDNNIVWSSGSGDGSMGGIVTRLDLRTGQVRNVEIWPDDTLGASASAVKYRFMWEFPLSFSPFDHNTLYAGSQYIHVTHDGGQSWQIISPDLTLNDRSKQQGSGGLTQDNIGVEYFDTVFSIAESPKQRGLIWAGTNDGLVQLTRDGGKNWTNLTKNLPDLPRYATISNIEPSSFDAATAYLTVDGHLVDNRDPYVYRTQDYGATWSKITNGLPTAPNGYCHQVIEDPSRQGLLFLGTEGGVYVSFNAGDQWQPLQNNLPHAPVYGLTVQTTWHDLDIATYGRGFWILDDITPLEKSAATTASAAATLYPLRTVYEFRGAGGFGGGGGNDNTTGNNPPAGADITYGLAEPGRTQITILDASGKAVRTLNGRGAAGINRIWWDLRGEPSQPIRVRTVPANLPSVSLNAEGWRNAPSATPVTLTYPPGSYTVKLTVNGQDYTQPLTVLKDPRSPATPADFAAQFKLAAAIQSELNQYAALLNQAEALRVQLHTLDVTLQLNRDGAPLEQQANAVDGKLVGLETLLYKDQISGQGEDEDRQGPALGDALDHLFGDVTSADYPPTSQEEQVNALLVQRLAQYHAQLGTIVSTDVVALNTALGQHKVAGITAVAASNQ